MPIEDNDFIMRQSKQIAQALGAFLDKDTVDDILNLDEKQDDDSKCNDDKNKKNPTINK
ncbi:hypothetical protein IGI37_000965 [Enterococcus sp. AZ194]|uniref:hypothetical protein n=1 Tax=Enterococcus sp. AZ194 TaxID=2774629 RepID=UPI003F29D608